MSTLRILSIVPYRYLPPANGGQKYIARFVAALAIASDLTVAGVRNNATGPAAYQSLPVLGTGRLRYCNVFLFFRLRKIIRSKQITHLIIEHPYLGWLAVWLQKRTAVRLVVHSHNIEGYRWKSLGKCWWRILLGYEKWVHRHADLNFFITEEDRQLALSEFQLNPAICDVLPYGLPETAAPTAQELQTAREQLGQLHGLDSEEKIILFNGAFNYYPNAAALELLLEKILPLLPPFIPQKWRMVICGSDIPEHYKQQKTPHVLFAGYVPDINLYFQGADLFVNPLLEGGGLKTKLVEALANGTRAVSFAGAAAGIPGGLVGDGLSIVPDGEVRAFAVAVEQQLQQGAAVAVSAAFYSYFSWNSIIPRVISKLADNPPR